ncbi:MAG: hypothetical protein WKF56_06760, partial [Candidatus Limnocylindrales bacterium]
LRQLAEATGSGSDRMVAKRRRQLGEATERAIGLTAQLAAFAEPLELSPIPAAPSAKRARPAKAVAAVKPASSSNRRSSRTHAADDGQS